MEVNLLAVFTEDCWQTEIIGGFAKWFSVFLSEIPVCLCYTASSSGSFCLHRIRIQCRKKPISEGLSMVIQIRSSFSFGSSFFGGFIQQKAASHTVFFCWWDMGLKHATSLGLAGLWYDSPRPWRIARIAMSLATRWGVETGSRWLLVHGEKEGFWTARWRPM